MLSRQLTSGSNYLESHQLVDGFGRSLQSQVNDTASGYRLVMASALNGLGQARYTSGSYQASGLAGTGYVTPTWASIPIYNAASYDALGRQTVAEARSFTTTLYSSTLSYQGWKTIATDPNGKRADREADAFGQLITVTEYLSNATISQATTYAYDFQGNLVKLVDALGNTTTITYDLLGRKLGMRDPDMGVWGYQYDGNNNLTRQTDARGQQIQFLFDALNRPIETRDVNASWTLEKRYYDEAGYGQSKGRRTRAEAYVGNALNNTIATSYDARGRVTLDRRSIGGENYDTDFGYDSANRVTGYRYPSQDSYVIQGYNSLGQPFSLCQSLAIEGFGANGVPDRKPPKDDCDWYVAAAYYNALGKSTEIQLGNGLSQRTNYFGLDTPTWFGPGQYGRTRQICVAATGAGNCYDDTRTGGTTATKLNLVYWFDALGNLTAMGDRSAGYTVGGAGQTAHSYGYDDLNRLVSGSASGGEFPNFASSWGFDGLGNMTYKAGMIQGYPASGPSSVRPHAVITSSNAYNGNYGYDLNGNMTARMDASVTYTQSWDAQNRLGSVTAPGKDTAWVYDADGARAIKVSGPITTVYIGGSVEIQISGTMRLTTTYYFFGGARIAMRVGETVTYLHGDRLGSASLATDAAGNVLSQERYYVWGSASMMSGTMPTDFQWQNQRRPDESQTGKLYDFNARFFTPVTGRFISPDSIVPNPADPQSLNRYTAMANNPLKFADPTGHYEACDDGACSSSSSTRNGQAVGGAFWRRNGGLTGRRPAPRSYELRIRSFAPFRSFGGGFRGDDRGYSVGFASSRTVFQIWYEPDRWSLESQVSNNYSHIGDSGGQSSGRGGISGFQMDGTARSGADGLYAGAEYHGSNGMLSAIPEFLTSIDVYAKLWIRQDRSNSALYVVGDLNGDNFPATEASISDAQGNTIMLGIGYYDSRGANKDWAPQAALPGYNHRTITSFALAVKLDDRGNFVSVGQLGSNVQMTIDQWNSQFTKCDPHDKSTC